jgi:hypothetical protein
MKDNKSVKQNVKPLKTNHVNDRNIHADITKVNSWLCNFRGLKTNGTGLGWCLMVTFGAAIGTEPQNWLQAVRQI